ncbi:MAG: hypothetical protein ACUVUC_13485 [Thermoguttaceae bacterium]
MPKAGLPKAEFPKPGLPKAGAAKSVPVVPKAGLPQKPIKVLDSKGPATGKRPAGIVPPKVSFADRVKTGDIDRLAKGSLARTIRLSEQYRLALQGDVARRMNLPRPVAGGVGAHHATSAKTLGLFRPHPHYVLRGWVSLYYPRYAFRIHWHLPYFFVDFCWYPRWYPWVDWSWHYRCGVLWDPRPIWCRPVVYVPVYRWVYWEPPVWTPLYSVPCGTWVDVPRVVVPEPQFDLELLAVRFVDPGHPEQKLGPRYRIWFRNNSARPVTKPFNVLVVASRDGALRENLPLAGVRVTAIEAGEVQSVDVRLPFEVIAMGKANQQQPAPALVLHVLVDSDREIPEANRANNGAKIAHSEILPVDPAAFEAEPASVAAGGELLIAGEGLGPEPGKVLLHLGGLEMEAEILGWYDLGVRLSVPNLPLASPTEAELIVVRGDGAAANPLKITVNPPVLGQPAAPPEPAVELAPPKP